MFLFYKMGHLAADALDQVNVEVALLKVLYLVSHRKSQRKVKKVTDTLFPLSPEGAFLKIVACYYLPDKKLLSQQYIYIYMYIYLYM